MNIKRKEFKFGINNIKILLKSYFNNLVEI
jgi:hypothetical protein